MQSESCANQISIFITASVILGKQGFLFKLIHIILENMEFINENELSKHIKLQSCIESCKGKPIKANQH